MRVTSLMMINGMKYNVSKNMASLEQLQYRVAEGKKFRYPSDDPIGVSRSLKYNTDISKGKQHLSNVKDTVSWMTTTEAALNELKEILHRTHELTVQAANGSNLEELDKIKAEIKELRSSMIQLANTAYAGRRLFSGYQTDRDLINKDGFYDITLDTEKDGRRLLDSEKTKLDLMAKNLGITDADLAAAVPTNPPTDTASKWKTEHSAILAKAPSAVVAADKNNVIKALKDYESVKDKEVVLYNTGVAENVEVNTLGTSVFGVYHLVERKDKNGNVMKDLNGNTLYDKVPEYSNIERRQRLDAANNPVLDANGNPIYDMVPYTENSAGVRTYYPRVTDPKDGPQAPQKPYLVALMEDISKDLDQKDQKALQADIEKIKKALDNTLSVNSEFGARVNRMKLTQTKLEDSVFNLQSLMSENENVDMTEAFTQLLTEENIYRANLGVTGRIIQPTLMDFLA